LFAAFGTAVSGFGFGASCAAAVGARASVSRVRYRMDRVTG
jgi:hypothetical protein